MSRLNYHKNCISRPEHLKFDELVDLETLTLLHTVFHVDDAIYQTGSSVR